MAYNGPKSFLPCRIPLQKRGQRYQLGSKGHLNRTICNFTTFPFSLKHFSFWSKLRDELTESGKDPSYKAKLIVCTTPTVPLTAQRRIRLVLPTPQSPTITILYVALLKEIGLEKSIYQVFSTTKHTLGFPLAHQHIHPLSTAHLAAACCPYNPSLTFCFPAFVNCSSLLCFFFLVCSVVKSARLRITFYDTIAPAATLFCCVFSS